MANQKEYKIIINGITESIEGIGTLQDSLDRLGAKVEEQGSNIQKSSKSMDELAKAEKKIAEYNEEYQRALQADKAVLADKNKAIKESLDLEKANMTVLEGANGTYNEKQQLLSALGKVIKNTNAETEEEIQKQNELKAQYAALNQELKDFDASLGNHQRNVGDYGQATKNLKQELREFQLEMANMLDNGVSKADPKFVELARKAGALKDAMADAGEEINRFASDTKKFDDVINIAQSATAAFELYKGAMSAFGVETEATEEAIQKLMGAMSIIQSLQTLSETLQNGSATARIFHKLLQMLGLEAKTAATSMDTLATAEKGATVATDTLSVSAKALRLVLASLGIGLVIWAVTELVAHWEELCDWFDNTFPIAKKVGGVFNWLKAVAYGLGKSIIDWLVNPFKTFADVISKIVQGDFEGAMKAAVNGISRQATVAYTSFKEGYQNQVERGLEEITAKAAAEQAKQTKYELDMLKARKGNQAKYSKEGIELQKKEFAERRKAAKGNADELRQIALDEANFQRECEEQKAAAAKRSADARIKANKDAAAEAKRLADEEAKRRKEAEEREKKRQEEVLGLLDAQNAYRIQMLETDLARNKQLQVLAQEQVDLYKTGPIDKYVEALKNLEALQTSGEGTARQIEFVKAMAAEWTEYCKIFPKEHADALKALEPQWNEYIDKLTSLYKEIGSDKMKESLMSTQGMTEQMATQLLTLMEKHLSTVEQYNNDIENASRKTSNTIEQVYHDAFIKTKDDAIAAIEDALKGVENIDTSKIKSLYHRLFNKKEVKEQEEAFTESWKHLGEVLDENLFNMMQSWQAYLDEIKDKHGEESKEYIEEQRKMYEAFKKYQKLRKQAEQNSSGVSSTSNMGAANGKGGKKQGKYVSDNGNTDFKKLFSLDPDGDGEDDFFPHEKIAEIADMLFENVFDPINEAFSAMLEFQIEEAQEALDKATEMHDKSVDQLEASQNKVQELNDKMKNSSGAQLEALKQQQADEMLLLAQREAEEKRLAREKEKREKELAKKQKQQRKLELQMQLVEGIVNTAVSVTKALTWGWPLGAIFAAIIGAMGAVQTAIIAKQISKLGDGGLLQGRSHAQGGIAVGNTGIEVEGGEYVVNKRSTKKYLPLLQAINEEGARKKTVANQLGKYANGGQLNYQRISSNLDSVDTNKVIQNSIDQIDMHPQVSVVDINRGQKNLTQVRQMAGASR